MNRTSGILLHLTSLPGPFGIGDLGPAAHQFVDFLADGGQGLWQVLPLGPTGYGDSPYQSLSAFAGNPLLISPALMLEDGWLTEDDLACAPAFAEGQVDYGSVIPWKRALLDKAYERFRIEATPAQRAHFAAFTGEHRTWLEDYCLFVALKEHHGGALWTEWAPELAGREPAALDHWRARLGREVAVHQFGQYQFFHQWALLRRYAHERGVQLVGDVPIFVAHDSADVWTHREWFHLDDTGRPTVVAGVPPDYFSATGQRWGNPLYRWDALAAEGYGFWVDRLRTLLALVDWVRLDHFRGFAAYWEIPASHSTAEHGRWVAGPGMDLFNILRKSLKGLPLIVEDLGLITWDVEALRERLQLPNMAVLQFAFGAEMVSTGPSPVVIGDSAFLPHNLHRDQVVYTGTHDNDTTLGWWQTCPNTDRDFALDYLNSDGQQIHWDFIHAALSSVANWAIIPLQDVLGLGSEGRLNLPGRAGGNWTWRYLPDALDPDLAARLRKQSALFGRRPAPHSLSA